MRETVQEFGEGLTLRVVAPKVTVANNARLARLYASATRGPTRRSINWVMVMTLSFK